MTSDSQPNSDAPPQAQCLEPAKPAARQWRNLRLATLGLALAFAKPLWDLMQFARHSDFHSYILLIPFISAYLVWLKKRSFWSAPKMAMAVDNLSSVEA